MTNRSPVVYDPYHVTLLLMTLSTLFIIHDLYLVKQSACRHLLMFGRIGRGIKTPPAYYSLSWVRTGLFGALLLVLFLPGLAETSPNLSLDDWKSDPVKRVLHLCQPLLSQSNLPLREDVVLASLKGAEVADCLPSDAPLRGVLKQMTRLMDITDKRPLVVSYRLKTQLTDASFQMDNAFGEVMSKGLRSTLDVRFGGTLPYGLSFEIVPRFRVDQIGDRNHSRGDLFTGYLKWTYRNLEIEAGRDSLWWGPGYHGGTALTNNAAPFDLLKLSNAKPLKLPWIFRHLGDSNLSVFWSRTSKQEVLYIDNGIDKSREDQPYFQGIRAEVEPLSFFRFGTTLTSQFLGRGNALSRDDWRRILFPTWGGNETEDTGGPIVNRRYAYDFLVWTNKLPLTEYSEFYWEYGGETGIISGALEIPFPKPQYISEVIGTYVDFGAVDLRLELFTPWKIPDGVTPYSHYQFTEGYRHEGRIIGHHAGPDTRAYFARSTYLLSRRSVFGLDMEYEHHYTEKWGEKILGMDVITPGNEDTMCRFRYEFHDDNRDNGIHDIHFAEISLFYRF